MKLRHYSILCAVVFVTTMIALSLRDSTNPKKAGGAVSKQAEDMRQIAIQSSRSGDSNTVEVIDFEVTGGRISGLDGSVVFGELREVTPK